MTGRHQAGAVLGALAVACSLALSGCVSDAASCPSWVSLPTAEDRFQEATAVITTDASVPAGTAQVYNVDAAAYEVTIGAAEKGDFLPGDVIRVVSMPDPCGAGGLYAEGDPMATEMPVRLYLGTIDGQWATITPFDGVVPLRG